MMRTDSLVEHKDEAYLEGKERDQILFELGLDPKDDNLPEDLDMAKLKLGILASSSDGDAGSKASPFADILKNVHIKNTAEAEGDWGEDEEEEGQGGEDDHDTSIAELNASVLGGASFADEEVDWEPTERMVSHEVAAVLLIL